jgi:NAD(P)H-dependent FMN reductase
MKIVSLHAENVKRLRAVEIHPDGNTVVIAGRNGQGKTSVLDSIWFALGGGQAGKDTVRPIRDGEDRAQVTLDLGELKVTRTWVGDKTALKVENADGARYSSPQAMLDSLVGRLSFDPLSFAHQDQRAQLAALLDLVDLPFDPAQLDAERRSTYDERTAVGREVKQLQGQLAGMPEPPAGLPAGEVSVTDLLAKARQAQQWQDRARQLQEGARHAADRVRRAEMELREAQGAQTDADKRLAEVPADLPDPAQYDEQLEKVESVNAQVRAAAARARLQQQLDERRKAADALTGRLHEIETRKSSAIAEARMPIDGLAFDDTGVTYQGVPFKQCSAAEQLRVSIAMAMALNPKVRVIRITDGSLLDSSNLALIEQMATDGDFQVWIERVDETGKVGILIEDGLVRQPVEVSA